MFDKMKEPVFLKENSSAQMQLEQLQKLAENAASDVNKAIEQEIKLVKAGIFGENAIDFELRNSHMPMVVLHDLYLVSGELSAQIDYLIITRKCIFILECKNLIGDIEINSKGDFIRNINLGGKYKKEGIYSPITQNKRHLELIKKIRSEAKGNFIAKAIFEKSFYHTYRPVVVIANPKSILNDKFAKKEVKQQVIRTDHLIDYLKEINEKSEKTAMSDQEMMKLGQYYLGLHQDNIKDYTEKYAKLMKNAEQSSKEPDAAEVNVKQENAEQENAEQQSIHHEEEKEVTPSLICPKCGAPMVKRTAGKGANAGKEFYGCSKFPKCKGIINIEG